jgi:hypothetical protein
MDAKSELLLKDVEPVLADLARYCFAKCPVKFRINEGLRTIETQEKYVKEGRSKTMNSKHLADKNGKSMAIDIVPIVEGYGKELALPSSKQPNIKNYVIDNRDIFLVVGYFIGVAEVKGIPLRVGALFDSNSIWNNTFVDSFHLELTAI